MTFAYAFDIGAACTLAFFVVRGALRGLIGEVVSLAGLVASVFCGWTFAQPVAMFVRERFPDLDLTLAELLSAVVLFMAVSLFFAAVGKMLQALVNVAKLSFLNHVMGIVLGAARAFFIFLFIYGVLSVFSPVAKSNWMKESMVMQQVAVVWPVFLKTMTDNGWIDVSHLTPETWTYPSPR